MRDRRPQPTMRCMFMTGSAPIDAEKAFDHMARARRRAALRRRLRREAKDGRLPVYDPRRRTRVGGGVREIPLRAIAGTVEPNRAAQFDCAFRPVASARPRWTRVWLAQHRGAILPPISVVPVGDKYAVSDGHHRVSVALANGAATIDAVLVA